jgi:hypothetical protein
MFRNKIKRLLGSFIFVSICSLPLVSCSNSVDDAKVKALEDKIRKLEDASKSSNPEDATKEPQAASTQKLSVIIKQGGSTINWSYDGDEYSSEQSVRAEGCYDFDGISQGGSVRVLNAGGKVVGLSKLNMRIYRVDPPYSDGDDQVFNNWDVFCEAYTVVNLPKTDIYQIKIGLRNAGEYSFSELEKANWRLNLVS